MLILLQGAGVYWFLLLLTLILVVTLKLLGFTQYANLTSTKGVLIVTLLTLISASSAEILVHIFINNLSIHPISWPLLFIHLVLLFVIVRKAIVQRSHGVVDV